ncbi:hypothetical protein E2C01_094310 [Portunus trituberculatus]|uniref:Uncharacterized protein n=1 Tax=Portunus trituberculatus TaxID=210409 RepID=A0A5B7JWU0_PORTR|nr:hypothetical protein [Portunus trituberculatus]
MVKKSELNGSGGGMDVGFTEREGGEGSGQSTYPLSSSSEADSKRPLTSASGDASAALDQEDPSRCKKVNKH